MQKCEIGAVLEVEEEEVGKEGWELYWCEMGSMMVGLGTESGEDGKEADRDGNCTEGEEGRGELGVRAGNDGKCSEREEGCIGSGEGWELCAKCLWQSWQTGGHPTKSLLLRLTGSPSLSFDILPDPVLKVTLAVSSLQKSMEFWSKLLGMQVYEEDKSKQKALLGYANRQVGLVSTPHSVSRIGGC